MYIIFSAFFLNIYIFCQTVHVRVKKVVVVVNGGGDVRLSSFYEKDGNKLKFMLLSSGRALDL